MIGKRIREARLRAGLSQSQLAHPELSDSYISLIESGGRTPTANVLQIIASKLDCSVEYLIHGIPAEQIQHIETNLNLARSALENGARREAKRRFAEVLSDANIERLPDLRRQGEYGLALAAEACGDLDEAIDILMRLRSEDVGPLPDEMRIASALALTRCYRDQGNTQAAINVAEHEISRMLEKGWTDHLIELGATLLSCHITQGDLLRAQHYSTELLSAADKLRTPRSIVAAHWNAAILAEMTGDYEKALAFIERAWSVQAAEGEPRNRARLHTEYVALRLRVRPHEAAACREDLLQIEDELRKTSASVLDLAYCQLLLARAEVELGHGEQAVEYGLKAVELNGETNSELQAEAQVLLAQAYVMLDRAEDAAAALQAAAEALAKEQPNRGTAEIWLMVASVYQAMGDQEGSRAAYQRAMECGGV